MNLVKPRGVGSDLKDEQIQRLQDQANERAGGVGGIITLEDIRKLKEGASHEPADT